jgi:hypothetical protein
LTSWQLAVCSWQIERNKKSLQLAVCPKGIPSEQFANRKKKKKEFAIGSWQIKKVCNYQVAIGKKENESIPSQHEIKKAPGIPEGFFISLKICFCIIFFGKPHISNCPLFQFALFFSANCELPIAPKESL